VLATASPAILQLIWLFLIINSGDPQDATVFCRGFSYTADLVRNTQGSEDGVRTNCSLDPILKR